MAVEVNRRIKTAAATRFRMPGWRWLLENLLAVQVRASFGGPLR